GRRCGRRARAETPSRTRRRESAALPQAVLPPPGRCPLEACSGSGCVGCCSPQLSQPAGAGGSASPSRPRRGPGYRCGSARPAERSPSARSAALPPWRRRLREPRDASSRCRARSSCSPLPTRWRECLRLKLPRLDTAR
ncbi:unnamed protein product, partial [Ectocarpus sp. 8 AP-2014]